MDFCSTLGTARLSLCTTMIQGTNKPQSIFCTAFIFYSPAIISITLFFGLFRFIGKRRPARPRTILTTSPKAAHTQKSPGALDRPLRW